MNREKVHMMIGSDIQMIYLKTKNAKDFWQLPKVKKKDGAESLRFQSKHLLLTR